MRLILLYRLGLSRLETLFLTSFVVYLIFRLFAFTNEGIETYDGTEQLSIVVPMVTFPPSLFLPIVILLICFCFFAVLGSKKNTLTGDRLCYFFVARLFFAVIQIATLSVLGEIVYFGNYLLYVLELFFYISCLSIFTKKIEEPFIKILKIFILVVAIETIVQSIFGVMPQCNYISLWYKSNMVIPLGASNTLSAIILPFLVAELFSKDRSKYATFFVAITTVAIFLTKSRFAMGILFIAYFIKMLKLRNKAVFLIFLLISLLGIAYIIGEYGEFIKTVAVGFSDEVTTGSTLNKISSGRVEDFDKYFNKIVQYPLWGYGPIYEESRAHNIIIDVLYQNGIIGLLMFAIPLLLLVRKPKINYQDSNYNYLRIVVIVFLFQSLGEISFFTDIVCDFLFLPCVALLSLKTNSMKYIV